MQHSDPKKLSDELASMLSENQQLINELDALMQDDLSEEAQSLFQKQSKAELTVDQSNASSSYSNTISDESLEQKGLNSNSLSGVKEIHALLEDLSLEIVEGSELGDLETHDVNLTAKETVEFNSQSTQSEVLSKDDQRFNKQYQANVSAQYSILALPATIPEVKEDSLDNVDEILVDSNDISIIKDNEHPNNLSTTINCLNLNSDGDSIIDTENTEASDLTWRTLSVLLAGIWVLFWLNQNSINTYFQQKYHQSGPLELFENNSFWRSGGLFNESVSTSLTHLSKAVIEGYIIKPKGERLNLFASNDSDSSNRNRLPNNSLLPLILASNDEIAKISTAIVSDAHLINIIESNASTSATEKQFSSEPHSELRKIEVLNPGDEQTAPSYGYLLKEGEKVFFAGDSLMQGVAPHVMNKLKKEFNISSINLSKQSTGLTYPKAFNWPQAIEKTLNENKDIGLLVMMLGANDPWDMQVKKGEPYLRFGSDPWDLEYQARIDSIYRLAAIKGIGVIWISAPSMKKEKLSKGVLHLDTLYKSINNTYGGIFLESNIMFGYQGDRYNAYATWNDKKSKIRADDGVHFTPTGQRIIAEYVLSVIGVIKTTPNEVAKTP